ncbi:MAG: EutN/CcmL family microcompartment protein [Pirellulales bacterium]|nr:EutN/CcmL family microcompartment protein [Pirellulales bacterium]
MFPYQHPYSSGQALTYMKMLVARVIGSATSTVKHASLEGWKLLVVQALMADGQGRDGEPMLAIDQLGAGAGDRVMITSDGKSTRATMNINATPVRWNVIGICDP